MNKPSKNQVDQAIVNFNLFFKGFSARPWDLMWDARKNVDIPHIEVLGRNAGSMVRALIDGNDHRSTRNGNGITR